MADLQRALEIAVEAHKGQLQKNGLPYVLHPITLSFAVDSIDEKIAALLHDVVEDTNWTLDELEAEGFAPQVIEALNLLTHTADDTYDLYIERISTNALARRVKLADLKDNMNIRRIPDLKQKDLERIAKYHRSWSKLRAAEAE